MCIYGNVSAVACQACQVIYATTRKQKLNSKVSQHVVYTAEATLNSAADSQRL